MPAAGVSDGTLREMRTVVSRAADRVLHTTALPGRLDVPEDAAEFHRSIAVVDMLVGSALMRPDFVHRLRHGHADLPRLLSGGVDVVVFTVATRHPDLRGTYSTPFFWSQGIDRRTLRSNIAIVRAIVERIEGWEAASSGRLRILRERDDLAAVAPAQGRLGALLDVQGAHALMGDAANVEILHALGIRMLTLAHVMDNDAVGSDTGERRSGLTGFGREVVAECERLGIVVDLAHMSAAGIRDIVPVLRRPFVLSHTGFSELCGGLSRWRRYTPGTRNVATADARLVAEAGGVIGVTLSTWLLGGEDLDTIGRTLDFALELAGPDRVAIGSDMDGGLRMIVDAQGMPAITAELLRRGHDRRTIAAVMGGNAMRVFGEVAR